MNWVLCSFPGFFFLLLLLVFPFCFSDLKQFYSFLVVICTNCSVLFIILIFQLPFYSQSIFTGHTVRETLWRKDRCLKWFEKEHPVSRRESNFFLRNSQFKEQKEIMLIKNLASSIVNISMELWRLLPCISRYYWDSLNRLMRLVVHTLSIPPAPVQVNDPVRNENQYLIFTQGSLCVMFPFQNKERKRVFFFLFLMRGCISVGSYWYWRKHLFESL